MTAIDRDRGRRVIALFADYLAEKEDIYITELEGLGFVILHDLQGDLFERNVVCRDARKLFEALQELWEADFLFFKGMENGCEDFDSSEESLTIEQRDERDLVRRERYQALETILES